MLGHHLPVQVPSQDSILPCGPRKLGGWHDHILAPTAGAAAAYLEKAKNHGPGYYTLEGLNPSQRRQIN